jgi:hypothetical protein
LALIEEINALVAGSMPSHPEAQIDELEELADFDIYVGDGHYHATSTYEVLIQGKRRAVGHFYTLNLRTLCCSRSQGWSQESRTRDAWFFTIFSESIKN